MRYNWFATTLVACVTGGLAAVPSPRPAHAAEAKKNPNADAEVEAAVAKGLEYLKKTQAKDGHWEAQGGQYPTSMTALAGMAFLMEGSTLKEGKYTDQVKAAVDWFLSPNRQRANGLIGDARNPSESIRYMYGQGFGTLFLASVYGEEEDREQREKLEKLLTKAVEFTCKAQTSKRHKLPEGKDVEIGGWGYVSAADDANFDEGSVTITALQGLRAAKNAGIPVPKETIDKAVRYLEACTTSDGGVIYNYLGGVAARGQERPALTAAAICCGFSAGQYSGELPKKWLKYCKAHEGTPWPGGGRPTTSTRRTTSARPCTRSARPNTASCSPSRRSGTSGSPGGGSRTCTSGRSWTPRTGPAGRGSRGTSAPCTPPASTCACSNWRRASCPSTSGDAPGRCPPRPARFTSAGRASA